MADGARSKQQAAERAREPMRANASMPADRAAQEANYFERSCHDKIKSLTEMVAQLVQRAEAVAMLSKSALATELENLQEGNIQERLQLALGARLKQRKHWPAPATRWNRPPAN